LFVKDESNIHVQQLTPITYQITVLLWVSGVVVKRSNVSEESTASIFSATEIVWMDATVIWRENFVGYILEFEIVWPITAREGGNSG
jgi:hypothetical protein